MATVEELEAQLAKAREKQLTEESIDRLDRAIFNEAFITSIEARDAAESHRSIEQKLSIDESKAIFEAVKTVLQEKLAKF